MLHPPVDKERTKANDLTLDWLTETVERIKTKIAKVETARPVHGMYRTSNCFPNNKGPRVTRNNCEYNNKTNDPCDVPFDGYNLCFNGNRPDHFARKCRQRYKPRMSAQRVAYDRPNRPSNQHQSAVTQSPNRGEGRQSGNGRTL